METAREIDDEWPPRTTSRRDSALDFGDYLQRRTRSRAAGRSAACATCTLDEERADSRSLRQERLRSKSGSRRHQRRSPDEALVPENGRENSPHAASSCGSAELCTEPQRASPGAARRVFAYERYSGAVDLWTFG